ncbi:MAG: methyltransferase domain-containing protein, partial [Candidatus Omnitrophota bacterium]|nr:methyltransferase domain-containing protein [Candidatus Omnitrophota bacterium]
MYCQTLDALKRYARDYHDVAVAEFNPLSEHELSYLKYHRERMSFSRHQEMKSFIRKHLSYNNRKMQNALVDVSFLWMVHSAISDHLEQLGISELKDYLDRKEDAIKRVREAALASGLVDPISPKELRGIFENDSRRRHKKGEASLIEAFRDTDKEERDALTLAVRRYYATSRFFGEKHGKQIEDIRANIDSLLKDVAVQIRNNCYLLEHPKLDWIYQHVPQLLRKYPQTKILIVAYQIVTVNKIACALQERGIKTGVLIGSQASGQQQDAFEHSVVVAETTKKGEIGNLPVGYKAEIVIFYKPEAKEKEVLARLESPVKQWFVLITSGTKDEPTNTIIEKKQTNSTTLYCGLIPIDPYLFVRLGRLIRGTVLKLILNCSLFKGQFSFSLRTVSRAHSFLNRLFILAVFIVLGVGLFYLASITGHMGWYLQIKGVVSEGALAGSPQALLLDMVTGIFIWGLPDLAGQYLKGERIIFKQTFFLAAMGVIGGALIHVLYNVPEAISYYIPDLHFLAARFLGIGLVLAIGLGMAISYGFLISYLKYRLRKEENSSSSIEYKKLLEVLIYKCFVTPLVLVFVVLAFPPALRVLASLPLEVIKMIPVSYIMNRTTPLFIQQLPISKIRRSLQGISESLWLIFKGLFVFLLSQPVLALTHEALFALAALTLNNSSLQWGPLFYFILGDDIYARLAADLFSNIHVAGIAITGPVGEFLHNTFPLIFVSPSFVAVNAWASAVVEPGSTVLARLVALTFVQLIFVCVGFIFIKQGLRQRSLIINTLGATILSWTIVELFLNFISPADIHAIGLSAFATKFFEASSASFGQVELYVWLAINVVRILSVLIFPFLVVVILPRMARRIWIRAFARLGKYPYEEELSISAKARRDFIRLSVFGLGSGVLMLTPLGRMMSAMTNFLNKETETEPLREVSLAPLEEAPVLPSNQPLKPRGSMVRILSAGSDFILLVNEQSKWIRGMGYVPPNPLFSEEDKSAFYRRDFDKMRNIGVNMILGWENAAYDEVTLNMAHQYGLGVVMPFELSADKDYADPSVQEKIIAEVIAWVQRYEGHPALRMWGLGNEVLHAMKSGSSSRIAGQKEAFVKFLIRLAESVHQIDPNHPVIYSDAEYGHLDLLRQAIQVAAGQDNDPHYWFIPGVNIYDTKFDGPNMHNVLRHWVQSGWNHPRLVTEFGMLGMSRKDRPSGTVSLMNRIKAFRKDFLGACLYIWSDVGPEALNGTFGIVNKDGESVDGTLEAVGGVWFKEALSEEGSFSLEPTVTPIAGGSNGAVIPFVIGASSGYTFGPQGYMFLHEDEAVRGLARRAFNLASGDFYRQIFKEIGLSDEMRILDIGFGEGSHVASLPSEIRHRIVGLEVIPEYVNRARKNDPLQEVVGGEWYHMQFPDNFFNAASGVNALYFAGNEKELRWLITEIDRVIKAGPDGVKRIYQLFDRPLTQYWFTIEEWTIMETLGFSTPALKAMNNGWKRFFVVLNNIFNELGYEVKLSYVTKEAQGERTVYQKQLTLDSRGNKFFYDVNGNRTVDY